MLESPCPTSVSEQPCCAPVMPLLATKGLPGAVNAAFRSSSALVLRRMVLLLGGGGREAGGSPAAPAAAPCTQDVCAAAAAAAAAVDVEGAEDASWSSTRWAKPLAGLMRKAKARRAWRRVSV
jgi:hypothetical protein